MFAKPLSDVSALIPEPRVEVVPPLARHAQRRPSRPPVVLVSVLSFLAGVATSGAALLLQG